jgi:hypothetical protein
LNIGAGFAGQKRGEEDTIFCLINDDIYDETVIEEATCNTMDYQRQRLIT